jgi:hypothetical protein
MNLKSNSGTMGIDHQHSNKILILYVEKCYFFIFGIFDIYIYFFFFKLTIKYVTLTYNMSLISFTKIQI